MNLKRIETFVLVATLKSFRKAAEQQFTTQPAISSRIAGLEEELGVKLFDRDASPVALTAKGRELLPYAEKLLMMAEKLQSRAENNALMQGTLRLGVSETIVHTWLTLFLGQLNDQFPNLDIDVTVDVTSKLRHDLLDRTLDMTFLMGPVTEPGVTNLALCEYPLVWAAKPNLVTSRKPLSLEDIAKWPIITYPRNTLPFCEIDETFKTLESSTAHFFTSSSLSACMKLALDGLGVATLPQALAEKEFNAGRLEPVNCEWTPSPLKFTASFMRAPLNGAAELAAGLAVDVANAQK
ncbi:LysR family transcriptional regulator [Veronia nyctiphanis]|uniref:LysR family transcriptional regulator n=1 Tax=Veronia nyctiphanis TaxID=1278244 RepID=A0A4V1LTA7_9GAMM|nr:LysR family transcriptional regulator [Veronia nyctiphanis]RXJ74538.1 LysR family transcriptional regulator [Veronia nyctiphanis]